MKYLLMLFFIFLYCKSALSQNNRITEAVAEKGVSPQAEYTHSEQKAIKSIEVANIIDAISFSSDGNKVLFGSKNSIEEIDINDIKQKRIFDINGHNSVKFLNISQDGKYGFSVGERDNMLKVWDIQTSKEVLSFNFYIEKIYAVAFSNDNEYFLFAGYKVLKLWNIKTGKEIQSFNYEDSEFVHSVTISNDGRYVAAGLSNNITKLWDVKTSKELNIFKNQKGSILSVSPNDMSEVVTVMFSPDNKYLMTGCNIHPNINAKFARTEKAKNPKYFTLKLWDIQQGKEKKDFVGGDYSSIDFGSFSPDGRYIFTSGDNQLTTNKTSDNGKVIKVWDISSSKLISVFNSGFTKSLAFSPDGKYVVSGGNKNIKLWDVNYLHIRNNHSLGNNENIYSNDIEVISSTNISKYELIKTQNIIKQYVDMLILLGESPDIFQAGKDIESLFENRNNYIFNDLELNGGNIEIYAYILKIITANEGGKNYTFSFTNLKSLNIERYKEKHTSVILGKMVKANELNRTVKIKIVVNPESGKIVNIIEN